jgi:tetraacyldisaccharide 4'-kinase
VTPPAFWDDRDALAGRLLAPLGWLYAGVTAWRLSHGRPWRAPTPVLCVGNLTAGGAGKTPVVRDLAARLHRRGQNPAILSRGYGGRMHGPLRVDPARHLASDVGDEPLLLAGDAPCWIAADRAAGARAIAASGAGAIVMDDGLQNPGLRQDLRILVVDGASGFGNGRAIPAGPLRETIERGLARVDAAIVMGEDRCGLLARLGGGLPVLRGDIVLADGTELSGRRVFAFAGIGRPEKFRGTLESAGAVVAGFRAFPDHHVFGAAALDRLAAEAARLGAALMTTEKDWMRLDQPWRDRIPAVKVAVRWREPGEVERLLDRLHRHA